MLKDGQTDGRTDRQTLHHDNSSFRLIGQMTTHM